MLTGATGFVGRHLTRTLSENGDRVHAIVRPGSDASLLGNAREPVTVHVHDGTTAGMLAIMKAAQPDAVIHLASLFVAEHKSEHVTPLIESNVLLGAQLVEAMVLSGIGRLVNTGTSWQHYEDRHYSPVCLYAATKQAFDAIVKYYVEAFRLHVVTLELFDTYGPDDDRGKLISQLARAASTGQLLSMSPGEQLLDLVYVCDVVDAFMIAVRRLIDGQASRPETFAVCTGKSTSLREVVTLYEEIAGVRLAIEWGVRQYRRREVMTPWRRGARLPGWTPKVDLATGIRRMIGQGV
ncbi:MAG: NAD-dependent epimerase/dehydratase family protein [Chloroflexi bacterium]|nr:NAD-dependent epimerase/dehydratase family protein [Chloroflexota bacterium]